MSRDCRVDDLPTQVPAVHRWRDNGELIADAHRLGHLSDSDRVLDMTYGVGVFWADWRPPNLVTVNGNHDFRCLPWPDGTFDVVVFDPPYKLNGTPTPDVDRRYGVDVPARWQDRMALIFDGFVEAARLTRRCALVKCEDQVSSGKVRWQTHELWDLGHRVGLELVDELTLIGHERPQPMAGRVQRHAHGRGSTLMIFRRRGVGARSTARRKGNGGDAAP